MKVSKYVLTRFPNSDRVINLSSEDGQTAKIEYPKGEEQIFLADTDMLRNEKPIYFRNGVLTTEQEPVGENE